MMTIKQYMLLNEVYQKGGDMEISFVTKPNFDPLEDNGYLTVYYELGNWRVSITDLGVSVAKRTIIITSVTRFIFMAVAVVAIICLFCSCKTIESTTSADSNHSTYSDESSVKERKDSIVYRDSISYVERIINDTVYITKEATRWRVHEKLVYDTLQVLKIDSVYVYRDIEKVIEKQPTIWQKIKGDLIKWLIICCLLFLAIRKLLKG